MTTARAAIGEALRALRAIAPGDDPTAEELAVALEAVQDLVLEIHEARGPMLTIDVTAAVVASENQRLRIQAGSTVTVTLPNAVPIYTAANPNDYGFTPPSDVAPVGTTSAADGQQYRAPLDGARIEIVGTSQALYFYREDLNAWTSALSLTLDSELPFNARLSSHFAAILAERLVDVVADDAKLTPALLRRVARGRTAMMAQTGRARVETVGQYF